MNILAIDPGLSGGIAIINDTGEIVYACAMPTKPYISNGKKKRQIDIGSVASIIAKYLPEHAFIEKVHAMPGQGVTSMFTFGVGYGMIIGICSCIENIKTTNFVGPQQWQKLLGVNKIEAVGTKERAKLKCWELFHKFKEAGVKHDGIIDAVLIAEYGRKIMKLN